MKKFFRILIIMLCIAVIIIGGLRLAMLKITEGNIYTLETVPSKRAVLVPGAGLNYQGVPSAALRDRLDAAIWLYDQGKVEKLLLTGDNSEVKYNEPGAMRTYALEQGIPDEDLVLDFAGRRTYDSCVRAHEIFGLDEVIVVTQAYHLPRAVFLCEHAEIDTVGAPVQQSRYIPSRYAFWHIREMLATVMAWLDVYLIHPTPILGDFEPIFP